MAEYIGYEDPIGNGQFNMGLTDEEIIRCIDCRFSQMRNGKLCCQVAGRFVALGQEGSKIESAWFVCDALGFCAWAEHRSW